MLVAYKVARNPLSTSLIDWIRGCLICTGSASDSKRSTRQYIGARAAEANFRIYE
jgi:hypothetical protein